MLDTGRRITAFRPFGAEVTEPRGDRYEIHVDFVRPYRDEFMDFNTDHAVREIMLLLASDLAGMTAGTPFVLYQ
jgi:hypothetical protein